MTWHFLTKTLQPLISNPCSGFLHQVGNPVLSSTQLFPLSFFHRRGTQMPGPGWYAFLIVKLLWHFQKHFHIPVWAVPPLWDCTGKYLQALNPTFNRCGHHITSWILTEHKEKLHFLTGSLLCYQRPFWLSQWGKWRNMMGVASVWEKRCSLGPWGSASRASQLEYADTRCSSWWTAEAPTSPPAWAHTARFL